MVAVGAAAGGRALGVGGLGGGVSEERARYLAQPFDEHRNLAVGTLTVVVESAGEPGLLAIRQGGTDVVLCDAEQAVAVMRAIAAWLGSRR